jgi:hypothetical protein
MANKPTAPLGLDPTPPAPVRSTREHSSAGDCYERCESTLLGMEAVNDVLVASIDEREAGGGWSDKVHFALIGLQQEAIQWLRADVAALHGALHRSAGGQP